MKIYFIKTDEFSFLQAFQNERLEPSISPNNCSVQDTVLFIIEDKVAGAANITSDDLKINFSHIFESELRQSFHLQFHSLLVKAWGSAVHTQLEQGTPIKNNTALEVIQCLDEQDSAFGFFITNFDYLFEEATKKQQMLLRRNRESDVQKKSDMPLNYKTPHESTSVHTKVQFLLKELAIITGCEVWTASNDKNRLYKGAPIGNDDLEHFPNFPMDNETKKRIGLIDTIWFNNDFPISCFEVETSTTVYSGLLRMADLISVMPTKDMKVYIVAPNDRKEKVFREMNRPAFRVFGLSEICRFISIESLEVLHQKVKGLDGFIDPNVLDAIALKSNELLHLES